LISVPAPAWRGGTGFRIGATGLPIGLFFGALAWLDSGFWQAGLVVMIVLGVPYGIWMARRMTKYWPGARALSGADRTSVVRNTRRGETIGSPPLAPAVVDYARAMHAVVDDSREVVRWLLWAVLVAAAVLALRDTYFGSARDGVASVVYLGVLAVELMWWPKRQAQLLANADRAAALATA
jgi:hypothetical protein